MRGVSRVLVDHTKIVMYVPSLMIWIAVILFLPSEAFACLCPVPPLYSGILGKLFFALIWFEKLAVVAVFLSSVTWIPVQVYRRSVWFYEDARCGVALTLCSWGFVGFYVLRELLGNYCFYNRLLQ
jgi:ABC-type dipeptide/oligopeptide/nickel transport system permease subunit